MGQRAVLTVRVPSELLAEAKLVCKEGESLNELVVSILEREVRRRRSLAVYDEIVQQADRIRARTGPQPDSTPMIRAMREGNPRGD